MRNPHLLFDRADNLDAIKSDGALTAAETNGAATKGVTMVAATYYFPLGSSAAPISSETALVSAHLKWNATFAGTITVETSNFPEKLNDNRLGTATDVTDFSSTAGDWLSENPTTAYVAVAGTGNSSTAAVVTAGGTNAGGCMFHLGNIGSRRCRIKVVCGTGGLIRCGLNGKVI